MKKAKTERSELLCVFNVNVSINIEFIEYVFMLLHFVIVLSFLLTIWLLIWLLSVDN